MGKKNKRQRAQARISEGANVTKKMRTAGSSFSKKKARVAEKTMQQELAKRRKQEEQRKLQEQTKKSTIRKKQARVPYSPSDWILLIGEGNFSFARALGRLFEKDLSRTGHIVATSYDSIKDLGEKYPDSAEILAELTRLGVTVLHGVDATTLHRPGSPLHRSIHLLQQRALSNPSSSASCPPLVSSPPIQHLDIASVQSLERGDQQSLEGDQHDEQVEGEGDESEEEEGEGEGDGEEAAEFEVLNSGNREKQDEAEEGDDINDEEGAIESGEGVEGEKASMAIFNKIVFNFPHTGCGVKDTMKNNRIHQQFMLKFFDSAKHLLRPPSAGTTVDISEETEEKLPTEVSGKDRHRWERDNQMKEKKSNQLKDPKQTNRSQGLRLSEIHVTLKQGEPYSGWGVPRLARTASLRAKSGLDFFPELYPGYEHRRTRGVARDNPNDFIVKAGQSKSVGAAKTYVFVPIIKELPPEDPAAHV
jgi:25S rRNA (uracil2634-N3)-methyltransferase